MDFTDYAELFELIKAYFIQATQQQSGADIFISYWIPIIQLLIVFIGSIAGLYKYYSAKNKEINEKTNNTRACHH